MCIVCNDPDQVGGAPTAFAFLGSYAKAQREMRKASAAMLAMSKLDRRYDRAHKQMLRVMHDWNMIEHTREVDTEGE